MRSLFGRKGGGSGRLVAGCGARTLWGAFSSGTQPTSHLRQGFHRQRKSAGQPWSSALHPRAGGHACGWRFGKVQDARPPPPRWDEHAHKGDDEGDHAPHGPQHAEGGTCLPARHRRARPCDRAAARRRGGAAARRRGGVIVEAQREQRDQRPVVVHMARRGRAMQPRSGR